MIERVLAQNFSLLRRSELSLRSGLTCISGESGAGKSLLFDAVAFACGGRAHRSILAGSAEKCSVELHVRLSEQRAEHWGPPWVAGTNRIRRSLSSSGRTQAIVNDKLIRLSELEAVLSSEVEISGQFESVTLFNPATHARLVDSFGGKELLEQRSRFQSVFKQYRELKAKLLVLRSEEFDRQREIDYLTHEVNELRAAGIERGEKALLQARQKLLENVETLRQCLASSIQLLTEADGNCAYDLVAEAQRELQRALQLTGVDSNVPLKESVELLESILGLLQEVVRLCSQYSSSIPTEARQLQQDSDRLDLLIALERKYRMSADDLPDGLAARQARLELLLDASQSPEEVALALDRCEEQLKSLGAELTALRHKAAQSMQEISSSFFRLLEFSQCELQVDFVALDEPTFDGFETVELLISLNPGEPARPLSQVASGGEASRLLLGIKAALADRLGATVMLLDEIEAGIGGRAAQGVASVLKLLAERMQVLAITHLPLVAASAEMHLLASKVQIDGRSETSYTVLEGQSRVREIARMLGNTGSQEELALASSLLPGGGSPV